MNETDFKNSKYIVCEYVWRGGYGSAMYTMTVVAGFADETSAINWMKKHPDTTYYLCPGPYMVQKPKPRESEVVYMS